MPVPVTGKIVPTDVVNDAYPVIDMRYGIGSGREVSTKTDRNAIPTLRRREGMVVYTQDTGQYWSLRPSPWVGTDADWADFLTLQPYSPPAFAFIQIAEYIDLLATGTTMSGDVTFQWYTTSGENVAVNSITITDTTSDVVLASGLANTGSHTLTLPSSITRTAGETNAWSITANDVKGFPISGVYVINWIAVSDATYYVNNSTGNDSNNGTSSGTPWATLQKAADTVLAGDTVHVASTGTPYVGFVLGWDAPQDGCQGHPISFLAEPGVTIDHRNIHTADGIDVEGCSYIKVDGFIVVNDGSIARTGIRISGGSAGAVVTNNDCSGAGRFGINGGGCANSLVQGNTCHDIGDSGQGTGHGIYWANTLWFATIRGNSCSNCPGDGIHLNGDASQPGIGLAMYVTLDGNTIHDCNTSHGGAAINPDGLVNSVIRNNQIYNANSAGITLYFTDSAFAATGNVVVNNLVITTGSAKWSIQINAGCINNTLFNNIFLSIPNFTGGRSSGAIEIDRTALAGFASNNNVFSPGFSPDFGETILIFLSQWQASTGQDSASSVTTGPLTDLFIDPAGGDFLSIPGAPQVDEGIDGLNGIDAPTLDLYGVSRPFNSLWDCGCFEYNPNLPAVVDRSPAIGASAVVPAVTATFNVDVTSGSIVFVVTQAGSPVSGSVSYDSGAFVATWTPDSPLAARTGFVATISGATASSGGYVMAGSVSWSFATLDIPTVGPFGVFYPGFVPATPGYSDATATTCGMRFTPSVNGIITGIRFYKGTTNTGTHTGTLWSNTGTSLGTVTFSGETSSGWQEQDLSAPVSVAAGTTYMVGYKAPSGRYSLDSALFHSAYVDSPLTAPADNPSGNRNGCTFAGTGFPASVGQSGAAVGSSYGVDVVFDARSPFPGQTLVAPGAAVKFTYNVPISNTPTFTLSGASEGSVSGSLTYDSPTNTFTFTPDSDLTASDTFTAGVSGAEDAAGNVQSGTTTWTFDSASATVATLFGSTVPGNTINYGNNWKFFGMRFVANVPGNILGIRFYKQAASTSASHLAYLHEINQSTGAHVTALNPGGNSGEAFTGETPSGWQEHTFSTPVSISAGQIYWAMVGNSDDGDTMSYQSGGFSGAIVNGALIGIDDNGTIFNGTVDSHFFDNSEVAPNNNYYIDVMFQV